MNNYKRGANFERKIVKLFSKREDCIIATRSAGSHTLIDVLVFLLDKTLLIQAKKNGYVSKEELYRLKEIQNYLPPKCLILIAYESKLKKGKIEFKTIEEMTYTKNI